MTTYGRGVVGWVAWAFGLAALSMSILKVFGAPAFYCSILSTGAVAFLFASITLARTPGSQQTSTILGWVFGLMACVCAFLAGLVTAAM